MSIYTYDVNNFDLAQIYESGQVFRWERDEIGHYYYVTAAEKKCDVSINDLCNSGKYLQICCKPEDKQFWEHYFTLDENYDEYYRILDLWAERDGDDAYLSKAVRAAHGMRILNQPVWETAISFIISQNNNISRIKKTIENICYEFYGQFPDPEGLCDIDGLNFGLGYRDKYISRFAQHIVDGVIDLEDLQVMPYEQAKALLKSCDGIGEKVANCILLYSCRHLEAFPIDTWMRKILNREFPNGFPYERYSGFCGLVQQIMFYYERMVNYASNRRTES